MVGDVEPSGGVDLVGVEMDPELTGGRHHGDRRSGVEGRQHPQESTGVLLQAVVDLHVVAVARPVELKVREPQDDLRGEREDVGGGS